MSARIPCPNCGGRIDLPDGFAKAKIRCSSCGYYAEVPANLRGTTPAPEPTPAARTTTSTKAPVAAKPAVAKPVAKRSIDPRDHRPKFEYDTPTGKPLLEGTHEFDDDKPYPVPGIGLIPCPHCRGELPHDSTFCVHCGKELTTGKKAGREFQTVRRSWEEGWPFLLRFQIWIGCQVVNVFFALLVMWGNSFTGLTTEVFFFGLNSALQAFILGTYDTLIVRRSDTGNVSLTHIRRFLFYKLPPVKLAWKQSHGVTVQASHNPGVFVWMICAYLFLLGIVPGVIFYWMVIRPDRFEVTACDVYGGSDEVLFRSADGEQAREVARVVAETTGLALQSVV